MEIETNGQAGKLAEQGHLQHPYNESQEPKRHCGLQGRALWLQLGLEEMQPRSESSQSCDTEPESAPGCDPGTPTVRDQPESRSEHPPAVNAPALGLTLDAKGGEGLIEGQGAGTVTDPGTDTV